MTTVGNQPQPSSLNKEEDEDDDDKNKTSTSQKKKQQRITKSKNATHQDTYSNNNSLTTSSSSSSNSTMVQNPKGDNEWRKLMNLLLQLRKVCNHIYLMPEAAPDPYEISEEIVYGSGKLLMLDRMLPRLKENGHRVLLFSQFTSMLDILEDYCEMRNWSFVRLDGETNRVKRRLDVRRFNAPNSSIFIFLISTRAGGLGK
jgi:SWI/SNF-related matrix-associated actin-dependent regulator of chromatin subfamily A member 5